MIAVQLVFFDQTTGDEWTKSTVIQQPHKDELIDDLGILWRVIRVTHSTGADIHVKVIVEGIDTNKNVHWELGHERGWELTQ